MSSKSAPNPAALLPVIECRGTDAQCGEAYGRAMEPLLLGLARQEIQKRPGRLSYTHRCWQHIERSAPRSAAFLRGIARGAHLSLDLVTQLSLLEEFAHQAKLKPVTHCTAFVAGGDATADGKVYSGMNWDWSPSLFPWAGLLRLSSKGSPRALTYHYPGLWACAGLNDRGLSLVWTSSGASPLVPPVVGVPTYILTAEILRRKCVADAVAFLQSVRHAGCFNFLLADATGAAAVVEGCPGKLAVEQSGNVLSRANHYEMNETMHCSRQKFKRSPRVSTRCRAGRMTELLRHHHGRINVNAAKAILTDRHGSGPFIHQIPFGRHAEEKGCMSLDSLLTVCEDRVLWTCRGGRTPGPWQSVEV